MSLSGSPTLEDDYGDFSAKFAISELATGTLTLQNKDGQYSVADRWEVVTLAVTSAVVNSSGVSGSAAFAGTTTWLQGTLVSPVEEFALDAKTFPITVASFFCTLPRKAFSTHTYATTLGSVISDVLINYCGVPVAFVSVTIGNLVNYSGVVTSTDAFQELIKLSEASFAECFVQVGGILTIEPWKTSASSVNLVIPPEAVLSVKRNRTTERIPTRMVVKGRYTGERNCGPKNVFNDTDNVPNKVKKDKCYINGAPEPSSRLVFKNLQAEKNDINNASFILTGDMEFDHMDPSDQKTALAVVFAEKPGDSFVDDSALRTVTSQILTRNTHTDPETGAVSHRQSTAKRGITRADAIFARMSGMPVGSVLAPEQSGEAGGDNQDRNRVCVIVEDANLQSEFGIVSEDVDNPYIPDLSTAFIVGVRRLQRNRMRRSAYTVDITYLPEIRLNHVVTFTLPDGTGDTVTGLVDSIDLRYTASSSSCVMTLVVHSFEDLDSTTYYSSNLLVYPECCGINQSDWVSSGDVAAYGGYFAFESGSSIAQGARLTPGQAYSVLVDLVLLDGPGSFRIAASGGSTASTTVSAGANNVTLNFTVSSTTATTVTFSALSGQWAMTRPRLVTQLVG